MDPDERVRLLLDAKRRYDGNGEVSYYDEVVKEVAAGVAGSGSIGKLDIAALIAWKRLRANTGWVKALMSLPDVDVRAQTSSAVYAAQDLTRSLSEAAAGARSALTGLPGMGGGADAVASTLCFVAAPSRMAVYDSRAHHGLKLIGLELNHRPLPGRYGRYMELVDQCQREVSGHGQVWIAREVDLALYQLGQRRSVAA